LQIKCAFTLKPVIFEVTAITDPFQQRGNIRLAFSLINYCEVSNFALS
jgi:hypothetical protein